MNKDVFDEELLINDYVIYGSGVNYLIVGQITKFDDQSSMIFARNVINGAISYIRCRDCMKIRDLEKVTLFKLKYNDK